MTKKVHREGLQISQRIEANQERIIIVSLEIQKEERNFKIKM